MRETRANKNNEGPRKQVGIQSERIIKKRRRKSVQRRRNYKGVSPNERTNNSNLVSDIANKREKARKCEKM